MYNTLDFLELKIQPAINSRLIPPHARSSGGLSPAGGTTEGAEGVAPTPVKNPKQKNKQMAVSCQNCKK